MFALQQGCFRSIRAISASSLGGGLRHLSQNVETLAVLTPAEDKGPLFLHLTKCKGFQLNLHSLLSFFLKKKKAKQNVMLQSRKCIINKNTCVV